MAKRFIDSTIWTQNKWFRKLQPKYKLLWLYLISTCDSVGVWEEDLELASFVIGHEYDIEETLDVFSKRIKVINGGDKWWIVKFCFFQYGELKEENKNNKPHQSYIALLKKHSLWKDYAYSIHRVKEKEKEKEEESTVQHFDEIWKKYPIKDGRKAAEKHFNASVKTDKDWEDINKALKNYLEYLMKNKVTEKYIKHGSTWFNNWRDWIEKPKDYRKIEFENIPRSGEGDMTDGLS